MKFPPEIWLSINAFRKSAFKARCDLLAEKLHLPRLMYIDDGTSTQYVYEVLVHEQTVLYFMFDYTGDYDGIEHLNRSFYRTPARYHNHVLIDEKTFFKLDNGSVKRARPLY